MQKQVACIERAGMPRPLPFTLAYGSCDQFDERKVQPDIEAVLPDRDDMIDVVSALRSWESTGERELAADEWSPILEQSIFRLNALTYHQIRELSGSNSNITRNSIYVDIIKLFVIAGSSPLYRRFCDRFRTIGFINKEIFIPNAAVLSAHLAGEGKLQWPLLRSFSLSSRNRWCRKGSSQNAQVQERSFAIHINVPICLPVRCELVANGAGCGQIRP